MIDVSLALGIGPRNALSVRYDGKRCLAVHPLKYAIVYADEMTEGVELAAILPHFDSWVVQPGMHRQEILMDWFRKKH